MGVFEDIHIQWKGREYTVPANRVMKAIAIIEEHVTLKELYEDASRGTLKLSRLSSAYAGILRFAGADVDDEVVYRGMMANGESTEVVFQACSGLMQMMVPPEAVKEVSSAVEGKPNRAARRAASSSRKRTRSRTSGD